MLQQKYIQRVGIQNDLGRRIIISLLANFGISKTHDKHSDKSKSNSNLKTVPILCSIIICCDGKSVSESLNFYYFFIKQKTKTNQNIRSIKRFINNDKIKTKTKFNNKIFIKRVRVSIICICVPVHTTDRNTQEKQNWTRKLLFFF